MDGVKSSVIRDCDYDQDAETLYITFVSGKTYAYDRVPPDVYDAFVAAESKGTFFNSHIRNHYRYAAVTLRRLR
jgi:KTSC domain